ncbi:hypothetical protein Q5424_18570 [Conexibacter sp. JD483]|uniref:hypothetical protein n=1 Tax=unclassified Conexibacter TaxID=2627773 RepID=UPI00271CFD4C|nr:MULTISPECIES: hypothetical protein [unclassified Conexibacter]MDO8184076.1 hypothetical protein [Conexibacter sp. CPCC 205706]MDO8197068.1 hypothetical protein [Conexibacter sp. CPCC 205762]MDR9371107.1 hypothetical protein [Conexibacter sp. JD483]
MAAFTLHPNATASLAEAWGARPDAARTRASRPARLLVVAAPEDTLRESFARRLAGAGHDVTLLLTGCPDYDRLRARAAELLTAGVVCDWLHEAAVAIVRSPHPELRRAYAVHRWLSAAHAARPFDVVHLPARNGVGALAQGARRLGSDYGDLRFVVAADRLDGDGLSRPAALPQLVRAQLERRSVETADMLLVADAAELERLAGWTLPQQRFAHPLDAVDTADAEALDGWHRAIAGRARPGVPNPPAAPTVAVLVVAADGGQAERIVTTLRRGTTPPTQIGALLATSPQRPLDDVETVVSDRLSGAARDELADRLDGDILLVLDAAHEPDPLLVGQVAATFAASNADALSLVVRDQRPERVVPLPDYRLPIDHCAYVPLPGPAIAQLLYPALAVGAYAVRRTALDAVGGYGGELDGPAVDDDLLARLALAGRAVELLPDPLLTAVADDDWSELRARDWGSVLPPAAAERSRSLLLPRFRAEQPPALAELPALAAGLADEGERAAAAARDERAAGAEARQRLEARVLELDGVIADYERHIGEQRELIALYERQKAELDAELRQRGTASGAIAWGLRRGLRGPVSSWPTRARDKLAGRQARR